MKTPRLKLPPRDSDDHMSESSLESTENDHHNAYILTDTESEGEQEKEFC